MTDLPTGTVTFLFTDLEGSTRLWEQHPVAMRDALARHDETLRDAVENRAGSVVKTTGDWPPPEPRRVRTGLRTGEATVRDGDCCGTTVDRAARISAIARGRQIVCSRGAPEWVSAMTMPVIALRQIGNGLRAAGSAQRRACAGAGGQG